MNKQSLIYGPIYTAVPRNCKHFQIKETKISKKALRILSYLFFFFFVSIILKFSLVGNTYKISFFMYLSLF